MINWLSLRILPNHLFQKYFSTKFHYIFWTSNHFPQQSHLEYIEIPHSLISSLAYFKQLLITFFQCMLNVLISIAGSKKNHILSFFLLYLMNEKTYTIKFYNHMLLKKIKYIWLNLRIKMKVKKNLLSFNLR